MPVAIPASITSSSVHIPTAIPVSIILLIFSINDGKIWSWDSFSNATLSQGIVVLCCILCQFSNIISCWVVSRKYQTPDCYIAPHLFSCHYFPFCYHHLKFNTCRQQLTSVLVLTLLNVGCALCYWHDLQPWLPRLNTIMDSEAGLGWDTAGSGPGCFNANRCTTIMVALDVSKSWYMLFNVFWKTNSNCNSWQHLMYIGKCCKWRLLVLFLNSPCGGRSWLSVWNTEQQMIISW